MSRSKRVPDMPMEKPGECSWPRVGKWKNDRIRVRWQAGTTSEGPFRLKILDFILNVIKKALKGFEERSGII